MSKQSLLLVDGDPRSQRVLEVSLKKAGFNVTTAVNGDDAFEKIALALPDLILSETKLEGLDGFELCQRLKNNPAWSGIPFVFLTAQTEIEYKIRGLELGCDDYLTKPIYIKEIVTRVRILLQKQQRTKIEQKREGRTRFQGRLSDMAVVDLIQTIEMSRKSGVIQFQGEAPSEGGTPPMAAIYFRDGKVIDAELGSLTGEDAIYRLLTWNDGEFEVVFRTVRRREVIEMTTQGLLMEGMRRLDEWGRLLEQLPNLQARFEVDVKELAARIGDIPDEHNAILKLFDGRRTLMEVIDASGFGDLETLEVIAKLYFEGLLFEVAPPPTRSKPPTEEWFPAKMLEATPTDPGGVTTTSTPDSGPARATPPPAPPPAPPAPEPPPVAVAPAIDEGEAIPEPVGEEAPGAAAASRLAEGSGGIRTVAPAMDEPQIDGPPTTLIFDETFQGEDATPLPGPMVEAIDDTSGPQTSVVESRGADTATAHGELVSGEHPTVDAATARELLTITPRRARTADGFEHEGPSVVVSPQTPAPGTAAMAAAEAIAAVAPAPPAAPAAPVAPTPLPARPNGATRAPRVVLPIEDDEPPPRGLGLYVIAGAAALAGVLVLWLAMRDGGAERDRRAAAPPIAVDAQPAVAVADAAVLEAVADARPAVAVADAAVVEVGADAAPDPRKIARELVRRARREVSDINYTAGLELAEQALTVRPKYPPALVVKADALRRMKRIDEAIAAAELATKYGPRYAEGWKTKGNILWSAKREADARAAFERFLELAPDDDDAENIRARLGE